MDCGGKGWAPYKGFQQDEGLEDTEEEGLHLPAQQGVGNLLQGHPGPCLPMATMQQPRRLKHT